MDVEYIGDWAWALTCSRYDRRRPTDMANKSSVAVTLRFAARSCQYLTIIYFHMSWIARNINITQLNSVSSRMYDFNERLSITFFSLTVLLPKFETNLQAYGLLSRLKFRGKCRCQIGKTRQNNVRGKATAGTTLPSKFRHTVTFVVHLRGPPWWSGGEPYAWP